MKTFLEYMFDEANAAGSEFEQKIADNIKLWLKNTGLNKKFSAKRYQKQVKHIDEDDGNRDEDYSDIEITDKQTGKKFFIECKDCTKSNIVTTMFDINEDDFTLMPVQSMKRTEIDDEFQKRLANDIFKNEQYKYFVQFLKTRTTKATGSVYIADILFGKKKFTDSQFANLVNKYNNLVDKGLTESDCKKFDLSKKFRQSTLHTLTVALLWRLYNKIDNTWDICHVNGIDYFGNMILNHYRKGKAEKVSYIQIGSSGLYLLDPNDNPLGLSNCAIFPENIQGNFDLKFTPRFGVQGMYITPRSKIASKLPKTCSFSIENRFPKVNKNI